MMKGRVIAVLLAVTITSGTLSGCGGGTCGGEFHVMGCVGNGAYSTKDEAFKMVDACQLSPQQLLMIDITPPWFMDQVKGMTCDQLRDFLAQYRQTNGDEPSSLFGNPALTSSPSDLGGIMYGALYTSVPSDDPDFGVNGRNSGVFVDFIDSKVRFGYDYAVISPQDPTTISLPPDERDKFIASLEPVLTWGGEWTAQPDGDLALYDWTIAIVTADSQLYRWSGVWQSPTNPDRTFLQPEGFVQVYQAFWALTGQ